ncbi:cellulose binding domain-containing protein [uncultured Hymenobacter sp.]|uniref:cellulose binding domain-containing protein n=1 Tax=uncultured Hymenobacter sp. TaxID=170016 RepID=UPI0035CBE178
MTSNLLRPSRPKRIITKLLLCVLSFTFFSPVDVEAQVLLTSAAPKTETFDGLSTSVTAPVPTGFKLAVGSSASYFGTTTSATTRAGGTSGTGAMNSSSGGGDYNFGNGVTATATDRALGFLTSSSAASPRHILLAIKNNTGSVIKDLTVDFAIEKYRTGTSSFVWNFYSSTEGTAWTAQSAGDASFAASPAGTPNAVVDPATSTAKSVTLTAINLPVDGVFYLRWSHVGGPSNGQALGLDDLVLTPTLATGNPTPVAAITTVPSAYNSPYCLSGTAGSTPFDVAYTASGTFTGSFKVQLSDAAGAFPANTTDNIIGSGSTSPIAATIPASTPNGTGYRIRVVNDGLATYGSTNGTNLTVSSTPATNTVSVAPAGSQTITAAGTGATLTATAAANSTFNWLYSTSATGPFTTAIAGATNATYQPKGSDFSAVGTYYVVAQGTLTTTCGTVKGLSSPVAIMVLTSNPEIVATPTAVPDFGQVAVGAASMGKSFTVSGTGLTAPLLVTPPAGFEIRTGTNPFACCVIELQPTNGTVSATTIEVRFAPMAAQLYQATIPVSSTGLPQQTVAVSGTSQAPVYPATVASTAATNVTATSVSTGGTVEADGGSPITARGVVWGPLPNPVLGTTATNEGSGTGTFTSSIGGLMPGTTYFVRAYATNGAGTTYGQEFSVTTTTVPLAAEPTQSATVTASQVTSTSLKLNLTGGNGTKHLVVARIGTTVDALPVDATTYRDSTAFGRGARLGTTNYVVYAGSSDTVTVSNLRPNTTYAFSVFEYNDNNTLYAENYLTATPGTFTQATLAIPAALLLEENFPYTAGSSVTTNNWAVHSGTSGPVTVANTGLGYTGYGASNIGNAATITPSGQDVNRPFAPVYARTPVYASFLVKATSASTTGDYFFHLGPAALGSTYKGRVYARQGSAANKVVFGISGSGTANTITYTSEEYNTGDTYLLVVKYDFDEAGNTSKLFVNPALQAEPATATATSTETGGSPSDIGSVALRQGSTTPNLVLDGIRVGTSYRVVRTGLTCLEPAPAFAVNTVCVGTPTVFTDSSKVVEPNATYAWDVNNDGVVDYRTKGNLTHTYGAAGTYTAKLIITQGTCSDTITKQVTVCALPTAVLSGTATICAGTSAPLTIHLTGAAPWQISYAANGGPAIPLTVNAAGVDANGNYTFVVRPTANTTYSLVTLTDGNCTGTTLTGTATVTVNTRPELAAPVVPTATAAYGQRTASVAFAAAATGTPAPVVTYSVVLNGAVTPITSPYSFPVGTTTVTATATNSCGTATQTFVVTVQATPASLSVLHQNADGQLTNNAIKPNLQLVNLTNAAIPYQELTVRYWLTVEDYAAVQAVTDYAQLGTGNVQARYVALPQPYQGAFGYVEYSFRAAAGSLPAKGNSGAIQSRINKQTQTNFSEADDYSYAASSSYQTNDRLTVYRNGQLVGGVEPAPVAAAQKLAVWSQNKSNRAVSNTISTYLQVRNLGNTPVAYQDLTVRYWFSPEGAQQLNSYLDYAELGANNVQVSFGRAGTETYAELRFTAALGSFSPLSNTGNIQYRLAKADWSDFNQANDFSYQVAANALAENVRITAYVQGQLVYGEEPAGATQTSARGQGTTALAAKLAAGARNVVSSYPNPFTGRTTIAFTAAQAQDYQLDIYDMQGRLVKRLQIGKAQAGQVVQVEWQADSAPAGVYMARLTTGATVQQLKLVVQ